MNKVGIFSQNSKASKASAPLAQSAAKSLKTLKGKPINPDYKLQLSEKSKDLQQKLQTAQEVSAENASADTSSASSADVAVDIPKAPIPEAPKPPKMDVGDVVDKAQNAKKAKELAETAKLKMQNENKLKTTPAIFFVKAFEFIENDIFSNGMKSMAEAVDSARFYSWNQKEDMIEQIKKRDKNQPVILVGHGFGGDTAVEIAQELNTIENGFRKVDLLVTLNATGFNNDFIPQNVGKNLNFITADNGLTDDGPNIALNYNRTEVQNFLRPEGHDELDESTDIQLEIMEAIHKIL